MMTTCAPPQLVCLNALMLIKPREAIVRRRRRSLGQRLNPATVPRSTRQLRRCRHANRSLFPCRNILAACPTVGAGIQSP
jgi:hypothetical protein